MSDGFGFGILVGALITFLVDTLFFARYKKEIYERLEIIRDSLIKSNEERRSK